MTYSDQVKQIRAARATRDQSRGELQKQLVEQLKLLRAQSKAESKETVTDPAILAKISSLRERIASDSDKLRAIENDLAAMDRLSSELQNDLKLLNSLLDEQKALQAELAKNAAELDDPEITPQRRAQLESEQASLITRNQALQKRISGLQAQVAKLQEQLRAVQGRK
jgi:chromosome segregation ATPase